MTLTRVQVNKIQARLDAGMTPEAIAGWVARIADLDEDLQGVCRGR